MNIAESTTVGTLRNEDVREIFGVFDITTSIALIEALANVFDGPIDQLTLTVKSARTVLSRHHSEKQSYLNQIFE